LSTMGRNCAVHIHDDDVPMERHHVWPLGMGGPNVESNIISVCSNGHDSIHNYMRLLAKGKPSWLVKRRFGVKVRYYAQLGLNRALEASHSR
jgi:5-methylcytosine-specific restriction endonuclease McrA